MGKAQPSPQQDPPGGSAIRTLLSGHLPSDRARQSDWALFLKWCGRHGHPPFPAAVATVALFLEEMGKSRSPATVRRYASTLSQLHEKTGLPNPCRNLRIKRLLNNRENGVPPSRKAIRPLDRTAVDSMLAAAGHSLRDLRDAAMLAVTYDTLLLRSELTALTVEDLRPLPDGCAVIPVPGRGTAHPAERRSGQRLLTPDTMDRLSRWLSAAGIHSGPLFRPCRGHGVGDEPLNDRNVSRAFQRLAKQARVDPAGISSLSCRFGAARDMLAAGLDMAEVMDAGGWRTPPATLLQGSSPAAAGHATARLAAHQGRLGQEPS